MAVGPDQNEWDFGLEGDIETEGLDQLYDEDLERQAENY
jgi:hypothetical protein